MKELLGLGIQPDILLCRCDRPIPDGARKKIALFCNVREARVIPALDVDTIYEVPTPITTRASTRGLRAFRHSTRREPDLARWDEIVEPHPQARGRGHDRHRRQVHASARQLQIAGRGADPWRHRQQCPGQARLDRFARSSSARTRCAQLEGVHGILVPGGFGERGTEGKIEAARFARERKVPYFGICFGMQMAVIEAARNLAGLKAPARPSSARASIRSSA